MKVFWSWQSDTPGKIGRFLVRDALKDAIEELKEAPDIEEPTGKETRAALHLDHDIQGVTGSPDLARTIFDKIDASQIVVADVTLVGNVVEATVTNGAKPDAKKLINSNVAIELGYAFHAVGDRRVLLVYNEQYGQHEDLPFDLRHKGGAIVFNLAPGAEPKQIQEQRKRLKERFRVALKPILQPAAAPAAPFPETQSTFNRATYFAKGQVVARAGIAGRDEVTYVYEADSFCYLRLIPVRPLPTPLPLSLLKQAARRAGLISRNFGVVTDHNEFGAVALEPDTHPSGGPALLRASTQLFQNGEIWSLSSDVIVPAPEKGDPPGLRYPYLPSLMFEQVYYDALRSLASFATKELGLSPPWNIELGLTGTEELHIAVDINPFERFWGPIRTPHIIVRRILNVANANAIDSLLLEFFSGIYDAAGHSRPTAFFGFPPNRPGSGR